MMVEWVVGVALFVKNSIDFVIKTTDNTNTFESIFIELSCKYKLKILIGACGVIL